jgi:hypothetical protein
MVGHTCGQQGPNVHKSYCKACIHKRQIIESFFILHGLHDLHHYQVNNFHEVVGHDT